jgi:ABC-type transport system substrate-binding protein
MVVNQREAFRYEAMLGGLQSGVPPDPGMSQNVYRSSGPQHYWSVRQSRPETPAEERIDRLLAGNVGTLDDAERHRTWTEIQNVLNEEAFLVWLPTVKIKVPVRNTFGNVQPTVIPHRILWNIDRVYYRGGKSPRV